jgi:pyruvate dehydrogenase E1 component alpha subunit
MTSGLPDGLDVERAYLQMARIREFELRVLELFAAKEIRGSAHPYIGMEAIAVGVCGELRDGDYITSTHRGHGHCIAKGLDLKLMMAEITGREAGYCRGRGGSMHITALRHGMLGADAIVAGSTAIAVGAAYALRRRGLDGVTVAFFGDGAVNQGLFHEAANLAAVLRAPVVFVCENNRWAISMPVERSVAIDHLAVRGAAYGMPGVTVDGNDVIAVAEVARAAIARARSGLGPTLLEAQSYRISPHSAATPTESRPAEELEAWRARDPLRLLARRMTSEGNFGPDAVRRLDEQVREEVEAAVQFALNSEPPDPSTALDDVYAPIANPVELTA